MHIESGAIINGVSYLVAGEKTVIYNSTSYSSGQKFRGGESTTYTTSGTGTLLLYEVNELRSFALEFELTQEEKTPLNSQSVLTGFSLEFELSLEDQKVLEKTQINGFSLELVGGPFYLFTINTRRL